MNSTSPSNSEPWVQLELPLETPAAMGQVSFRGHQMGVIVRTPDGQEINPDPELKDKD